MVWTMTERITKEMLRNQLEYLNEQSKKQYKLHTDSPGDGLTRYALHEAGSQPYTFGSQIGRSALGIQEAFDMLYWINRYLDNERGGVFIKRE